MCTIAALLIFGALLELIGIVLVAWDVRDALATRAELSSRDQLVQVGADTAELGGAAPTVDTGATALEPPLEQRVEALEQGLRELAGKIDALDKREKRDHRAMLDRVASWIAEARRETFELRQELRPLIGSAVAGSIRRRAAGVAFFMVGLIVQTIANVAAL